MNCPAFRGFEEYYECLPKRAVGYVLSNVMTTYSDFRPLTNYVGAEISGIDLKGLDEATVKFIWRLFLAHQEIFF